MHIPDGKASTDWEKTAKSRIGWKTFMVAITDRRCPKENGESAFGFCN
jgi:hypothetical protein